MKAQISSEFMMVGIILIAAVTIMGVVSVAKTLEIQEANLKQNANQLLDITANALNTVYLEGDGFSTNITLPPQVSNFNYTVSVNKTFLIITANRITFSRSLITELNGSLVRGNNKIQNIYGVVSVV